MQLYVSTQHDPYVNVAMERELMAAGALPMQGPGACLLWVNDPCAVVGRNQNPLRETDPAWLKEHDVKLVRRLSGGGAVYHDHGNLNYSFVARRNCVREVADLVLQALARLGIEAQASGRNDLVVAGRKVGGMAWLEDDAFLCHGTLLVSCDLERMEHALRPSGLKLLKHGISSVRARVANLDEFVPNMVVADVMKDLCSTLGRGATPLAPTRAALEEASRLASEKWLYGQSPAYDVVVEQPVEGDLFWAEARVVDGMIAQVTVTTDALVPPDLAAVEQSLIGRPFSEGVVREALCNR